MAVQVLGKVAYFNKGAYNSQTNYEINDVVSYNGSSYVSLNDNNQGNLPTNTNYWSVVAEKGDKGDTGKPFVIEKTYSTIESMVADYDNMNVNDYVMIQGSIEEQENATLWTKREVEVSPYKWAYLADFSGASGITGATPNIHIGTVTEGNEPSVTRRSGSSNENPILDFVLKTGAKGDTGATGNGISSFEKTSTSGLVDTYTITFTNGTSTTIEVTNGRGIVNIAKTSSVDYVDTYTITYNDGTTSTFEVANSEVTEEEFNDVVDELNYLYDDLPKVEGEGTNLTLDNTRKGKMSNVLKGNDLSQFTTTGKNLFDKTDSITEGYSYANDGKTAIVSVAFIQESYIPVNSNAIYTFSEVTDYSSVTNNRIVICEYDSNKNFIKRTLDQINTSLTITTTSTTAFVRLCGMINAMNELQFETGNSRTSYEPYTGGNPAPNPDYPQDVHVVSGNNNIDICGENLFDVNNPMYVNMPLQADGVVSGSSSTSNVSQYIQVRENTNYTLSLTNDSNSRRISFYSKKLTSEVTTEDVISAISYSGNTKTFETPTGCKYIRFSYYNTSTDVQLEQKATATNFQPYESQTYPINLGTMELCKIGDYQDYIAKSTGKNLFDDSVNNNIWLNTDGNIVNRNGSNLIKINCSTGDTYTISATFENPTNTTAVLLAFFDENDNMLGRYASNNLSKIVITQKAPENTAYLYAGHYEIKPTTIQLEKNSIATDYEPYGKGKWYKHSEIGKQILDGTEAWIYSIANLVFYSDVIQTPQVVKNSTRFYCNRFNYVSWTTSFENMLNGQGRYQADGNHRLILKNTAYTTSNDFKNWLSNNNTSIYYVLATPTNTEITDQTLIAQLDNFEKALSYNTQTNISQENNDLPFIISASAFMSLKYIFGNLETRVAELEG